MLTIKRYDKDLLSGVIYGWDLAKAFEGADYYVFVFEQRIGDKEPVTCRIEREITRPIPNEWDGYKCEVFQVGASWRCIYMLQPEHIRNSVLLYELVESTLENHKDSIV
jgi:hypothetical protein